MCALGRVVSSIVGKSFSPSMKKKERLYNVLLGIQSKGTCFSTRTLGGCRIIRGNGNYSEKILICREARGLPKPLFIEASTKLMWDSRFQVQFGSNVQSGLKISALGELENYSYDLNFKNCDIPSSARIVLPTLFDKTGIVCIPHLGFLRSNEVPIIKNIRFCPPNSISRVGFFLR